MGSAYMRNLMGMQVSEDELQRIPYPKLELGLHITARFIQAGAFLGAAVAAPTVTALAGPRTLADLADRCLSYGVLGARLGAVTGPIATIAIARKQSNGAIYDRCYRLRSNAPQLRHDRFFLGSVAVGAAVDGAAGAVTGVLAAIAMGTVYNTVRPVDNAGHLSKMDEIRSVLSEQNM